MDGSFGDFGWGHLGREGARTDEMIEFFLEIITASGDLFDMGRADGLVGLLGAGRLGLEVFDFKIIFTVFFLDIARDTSESLLTEV